LTDLGNAERLVLAERDDAGNYLIHYSQDAGWRYFEATHWKTDITSEIGRRAIHAVRRIHLEADKTRDKDMRQNIYNWEIRSEAAGKITAMVELTKIIPGISVEPNVWDKNPWLLNYKNGTANLHTGEFYPHRRQDFITKLIDLDYDPKAQCPEWEKFLTRILPNSETQRFVQRAVGYSLTGLTREHCFFILYGTGANGKSTFLDTLRAMMFDYGGVVRAESLMISKNNSGAQASPDIAALRALRLVTSSETDEDRHLAEGLIKEITGNRTIKARHLYQNEFEFEPTFKIWLAVNHLPRIKGTDEGIWRRLRRLPFNISIPLHEQDKTLIDKLLTELPGIHAWAMTGLKIYLSSGLGTCPEVDDATREYREQSDLLKPFIDECCITGPSRFVEKSTLYEVYSEWCKKNGEYTLSKQYFGTRIVERGFKPRKSGKWFWDGIGIIGGSIINDDWSDK
jgi:putative DNA primase/helicase